MGSGGRKHAFAPSGPLLDVVEEAGGVAPQLFSAIALVAVANGALLTGIMSSRLAYGMARDGLLPSVLGTVLPGRRTPGVAIAVTTVLSMSLALTGDVATPASTLVLLLFGSGLVRRAGHPGEAQVWWRGLAVLGVGAVPGVMSRRAAQPKGPSHGDEDTSTA